MTPTTRVLTINSDPGDLAVLASVAAAHGFALVVLEPEADVVAEATAHQPDAIVLDARLRDRDGHATCRALKANRQTRGIPVILTNADDTDEARRRAFDAGSDDFLDKPLSRQLLAIRLHSLMRLRETIRGTGA